MNELDQMSTLGALAFYIIMGSYGLVLWIPFVTSLHHVRSAQSQLSPAPDGWDFFSRAFYKINVFTKFSVEIQLLMVNCVFDVNMEVIYEIKICDWPWPLRLSPSSSLDLVTCSFNSCKFPRPCAVNFINSIQFLFDNL